MTLPARPRLAPHLIERARTRRPLSELIAGSVALRRAGRELTGLCPFHQERTPSFTVVDAKGFYHCFGCGAHGDAITWRMLMHADSFADAVAALAGESVAPAPAPPRPATLPRPRGEDGERIDLVRHLWRSAAPIAGTPGEGYFRGRGITLALPPTLRYLERCPRGPRAGREYLPAVVCAVQQGAPGAAPVALHRIYLEPATLGGVPRKIAHGADKMLLGSPGAGSIRLAPAAASMARCEGVETGLAVQQATGIAVWSAIHGGQMARQEFPAEVAAVTTFADRDRVSWKPGPMYGRRPGSVYAAAAVSCDRAAGRRALLVLPPGDKADFNDLLVEGAALDRARAPAREQESA